MAWITVLVSEAEATAAGLRRIHADALEATVRRAWVDARALGHLVKVVFDLPVRAEKRDVIPAPTHVDGTGRLQTVSQRANPKYWRLIREFANRTGVPVVLNTSFNDNEPIVCRPEEAIDCFLRTKMDVLAMGNVVVEKPSGD